MRRVKVEQAEAMMVPGYEFHTFECSSCLIGACCI
jgi:hypothetical protein